MIKVQKSENMVTTLNTYIHTKNIKSESHKKSHSQWKYENDKKYIRDVPKKNEYYKKGEKRKRSHIPRQRFEINLNSSIDSVTFNNIEEHDGLSLNKIPTIVTQKHSSGKSYVDPSWGMSPKKSTNLTQDVTGYNKRMTYDPKSINLLKDQITYQMDEKLENSEQSDDELVIETLEEVEIVDDNYSN